MFNCVYDNQVYLGGHGNGALGRKGTVKGQVDNLLTSFASRE